MHYSRIINALVSEKSVYLHACCLVIVILTVIFFNKFAYNLPPPVGIGNTNLVWPSLPSSNGEHIKCKQQQSPLIINKIHQLALMQTKSTFQSLFLIESCFERGEQLKFIQNGNVKQRNVIRWQLSMTKTARGSNLFVFITFQNNSVFR